LEVDARSDAAAQQDVARSKVQQQPLSPAELQRLRASKQLEDLLAMIRYTPRVVLNYLVSVCS
jgi:hypothetical protein